MSYNEWVKWAYSHKGHWEECTWHVNSKLVNTNKYFDKLVELIGHKDTDEDLYNESLAILNANKDSEYEHIAAIDARTGKVLAKNTMAAHNWRKLQSGFTKKQNEMPADESTPLFETLHKHPNNSVPSRDDIRKLFEKPKQTALLFHVMMALSIELEK